MYPAKDIIDNAVRTPGESRFLNVQFDVGWELPLTTVRAPIPGRFIRTQPAAVSTGRERSSWLRLMTTRAGQLTLGENATRRADLPPAQFPDSVTLLPAAHHGGNRTRSQIAEADEFFDESGSIRCQPR